jgi:hypothetical protein
MQLASTVQFAEHAVAAQPQAAAIEKCAGDIAQRRMVDHAGRIEHRPQCPLPIRSHRQRQQVPIAHQQQPSIVKHNQLATDINHQWLVVRLDVLKVQTVADPQTRLRGNP